MPVLALGVIAPATSTLSPAAAAQPALIEHTSEVVSTLEASLQRVANAKRGQLGC